MTISNGSVWPVELTSRTGDRLDADATCDVCVVGAGIAGLTIAYKLVREGKKVFVLDAKPRIAAGETEFTTAHLASIIDDRFGRLISVRGADVAKLAHQSHAAAIDFIEATAAVEKIHCAFARLDGYLFPGRDAKPNDILDEEKAAREAGVAVEVVDTTPLPNPTTGPALRFPKQARFHPLKYLTGLAAAVRAKNGRIITDCRATKIEGSARPVVHTADGKKVAASAVVLATNTPPNGGAVLNSKLATYTTYALSVEVTKWSVPDALFWDTEDPYHYVRLFDGVGDRLIVGGEDHKTGQHDPTDDRWAKLEVWVRERFPAVGRVSHRWSGMVFETLDGLGLIGPDPEGRENVYIATGDSGMGMTHGTIAGLLLTDLILGRPNPWAEAYSPTRVPVAAVWTYLTENANLAGQYADWIRPGDDADKLGNGDGAVVRRGLSMVAVYKDDAGKVHEMSAVCPHMAGVVRWNPAERSWDCPCHGSRFAACGRMIHGPATDDLKPITAQA